jgi:hypothetical protein
VITTPVVFVLAIVLRPMPSSNYVQSENDFAFRVEKMTNSTAQLSVELINSLKEPSCLVYVSFNSDDILLGKIDRQGIYKFELPTDNKGSVTVRLYDAIHKKVIIQKELPYHND